MKQFIKFTNDADAHKGNPIYINRDHIAAVYDFTTPNGIKTCIYGGQTGVVWEVSETMTEVLNRVNGDVKGMLVE